MEVTVPDGAGPGEEFRFQCQADAQPHSPAPPPAAEAAAEEVVVEAAAEAATEAAAAAEAAAETAEEEVAAAEDEAEEAADGAAGEQAAGGEPAAAEEAAAAEASAAAAAEASAACERAASRAMRKAKRALDKADQLARSRPSEEEEAERAEVQGARRGGGPLLALVSPRTAAPAEQRALTRGEPACVAAAQGEAAPASVTPPPVSTLWPGSPPLPSPPRGGTPPPNRLIRVRRAPTSRGLGLSVDANNFVAEIAPGGQAEVGMRPLVDESS